MFKNHISEQFLNFEPRSTNKPQKKRTTRLLGLRLLAEGGRLFGEACRRNFARLEFDETFHCSFCVFWAVFFHKVYTPVRRRTVVHIQVHDCVFVPPLLFFRCVKRQGRQKRFAIVLFPEKKVLQKATELSAIPHQ